MDTNSHDAMEVPVSATTVTKTATIAVEIAVDGAAVIISSSNSEGAPTNATLPTSDIGSTGRTDVADTSHSVVVPTTAAAAATTADVATPIPDAAMAAPPTTATQDAARRRRLRTLPSLFPSSTAVSTLLLGNTSNAAATTSLSFTTTGTTPTSASVVATAATERAKAVGHRLQSWRQHAADALLLSEATVYHAPPPSSSIAAAAAAGGAHTQPAETNDITHGISRADVPVESVTSVEPPLNEAVMATATPTPHQNLETTLASAPTTPESNSGILGAADATTTPRDIATATENAATAAVAAKSTLTNLTSRYWTSYTNSSNVAGVAGVGSGSTPTTTSATTVLAKAKALLLTKSTVPPLTTVVVDSVGATPLLVGVSHEPPTVAIHPTAHMELQVSPPPSHSNVDGDAPVNFGVAPTTAKLDGALPSDDDDDDDVATSSNDNNSNDEVNAVGDDSETDPTAAPSIATSTWAAAASAVADSAVVFRGRYDDAAAAALAASRSISLNPSRFASAVPHAFRARPEHSDSIMEPTDDSSPAATSSSSSSTTSPPLPPAPLDQATRIRQMTTATVAQTHYQQLTANLAWYEYILLLGRGRLGVTLQQSYKLGAGVYVDALVPDGAAALSKLVSVGDVVMAVGTVSCQTHSSTIATVPAIIAAASRPVHLTLASSGCQEEHSGRLNHVDVAVAVLHMFRAETFNTNTTNIASEHQSSEDSLEPTSLVTLKPEQHETTQHPIPMLWERSHDNHSQAAMDAMVNPAVPCRDVSRVYWRQAAHRNTDEGLTVDFCKAASQTHANVRHALGNALLLCVADGRRLVFWQRHIKEQQQQQQQRDALNNGAVTNYSAMLSLYVGMYQYTDLYGIMSVSRRFAFARTIAHKFLLPMKEAIASPKKSSTAAFVPPPFDFHTVVPDSSLRALEAALYANNANADLPRTVFLDFQSAIFEMLAESSFLHFFVSDDCARMRAYLRNTAPFINLSLSTVTTRLSTAATCCLSGSPSPHDAQVASSKNYLMYILIYLLCMMDQERFGEHDDVLVDIDGGSDRRSRIENAASGLCATLFIRYRFLPLVTKVKEALSATDSDVKSGRQSIEHLQSRYEQLWEFFVSPGVGSLIEGSRETRASNCLQSVRSALEEVRSRAELLGGDDRAMLKALVDSVLIEKVTTLADELLLDYAIHLHPKFRVHKFHEWMCTELASTDAAYTPDHDVGPTLPDGCIKRLMRKVNFPVGITPHQASHDQTRGTPTNRNSTPRSNAECAVVFGTIIDSDLAPNSVLKSATMENDLSNIRRYTCQSLETVGSDEGIMDPSEVPATLESYAFYPLACPKPFASSTQESWKSADGWEVKLVNFIVPRADPDDMNGEASFIYGVSLVLQCQIDAATIDTLPGENSSMSIDRRDGGEDQAVNGVSPVILETFAESVTRKLSASCSLPRFSKHLHDRKWSRHLKENAESCVAVGLVLLSKQNVILAMRESLACLLSELTKSSESNARHDALHCNGLADILGTFANADVEPESLRCILEPFLRRGSKTWVDRPVGSQRDEYLRMSGHQLARFLPPIPLALTFIAALLEQKILLISSRRSVLSSTVSAIVELLRPLTWCHLLVPLVPATLAGDLLQYPGPFILGLASEDHGVIELIRDLPEDVTLVDLDIGRVILAPSFALNNEFGRGASSQDAAQILRSQVLYLAQSFGSVIGARLDPQSWCSDIPPTVMHERDSTPPFDRLRSVCRDFIQELLAGVTSCCFWIEETASDGSSKSASTVLIDEDRFFRIKKAREKLMFSPLFTGRSTKPEFALSLNDFDLVVELFLRCQSMNAYIGSLQGDDVVFSL